MYFDWKLAASGFLLVLVCFVTMVSAQETIKENSPGETQEVTVAPGDAKSASAENLESSKKESDSPEKKEEKKGLMPENYRLLRGEKEFSWVGGISPFNPSNFAGPKEYDVYGRDLHLTTLRFGRVIGTRGFVTYQYFFSASPLAVFTKNEVKNPAFVSKKETPNIAPTMRKTSWGFGVQPVNFRFIFLPDSRIKPFAQVGAGILITNKAIPVPYSKPLNFTGDFGGGVQYFTSRRKAITFGYKYFHISNGNIGGKEHNPGYNANVFYVSYSIFQKK